MATAKMKICLPLVVWIIWLHRTSAQSFGGIGFGIKREVFFLNLEDGYFGCQVNESTDVLQLFELSKLCDGTPNCYLGSDELAKELKCTDDCRKEDGTVCQNGACLDNQCYCNDGYGGCSCEVPDENECKYRPCDVFAHCTNTLGSFHCTCFPGYVGDGFHCEDIDECADPAIAARCVENAECCNLPAHFLCKCLPGFTGDGEVQCTDIDECQHPNACGPHAICQNVPGNYTCVCPEGFHGDPFRGCVDVDECQIQGACAPGAHCRNVVGGRECFCPPGFEGDPYTHGCLDMDECSRGQPCGRNALCTNLEGSFRCACPPGFIGDPMSECTDILCRSHSECSPNQACINKKCQNPCVISNPCSQSQDCQVQDHQPVCVKVCQCQKDSDCGNHNYVCDGCQCAYGEPRVPVQCPNCPPGVPCDPLTGVCLKGAPPSERAPKPCKSDMDCLESEACYMSLCQDPCEFTDACAKTAVCQAKMHRPICTCPMGYEGNPATNCFKSSTTSCSRNEDCPHDEACIDHACQRPCDVRNPCAQHAVCINVNHGSDCSCEEGFQGNGYVGCTAVIDYKPICQYNEDCPPNKLCDRLNRICINPCFEDSCGENAECIPKDHGIDCRCLPGHQGNPFVECLSVQGCRSDAECASNEACLNGECASPCRCGTNAICEVNRHVATCKCPPGYQGDAHVSCQPPQNPCDPNPCGLNALCELDNGNPICFCPKGLTGNPFKNCIPEGDECKPNPCGPNSGCRVVGGNAVCFCLPEFEGTPPHVPCALPQNPCDPSPCGPNTQCTILSNGFAKCTCLPGFLESPNTIRGCVEAKNPCEPNPCGQGAICDPLREPVCVCPVGTVGNPFRSCSQPKVTPLCSPGPCGPNADCYVSNNQEQCYCRSGYIGNPYSGCRLEPPTPCTPNPCGPGAQCVVTPDGNSMCQCPDGMGGDPTGPAGCHGYECVVDENCPDHQACIGYKCKDPCPGCCGINALCRVEQHHPICTCRPGFMGNPPVRCYPQPERMPDHDPCLPSPCGENTVCQSIGGRAVCSCLPDFNGDPQTGCRPECTLNTECPLNKACVNRHCVDPCSLGNLCGLHATCQVRDHIATCLCPDGYMGDAFLQCIPTPTVSIPTYPNATIQPCLPSPCGEIECSIYGTQIAICDPCLGPGASYNPQCRPECLINADCPFDKACLGFSCTDPCPGSCGVNAECSVISHTPVCSCPTGLVGDPFQHCSVPLKPDHRVETCETTRCGANAICKDHKNAISCICKKGYYGNPWIACRPECVVNSDCPLNKACISNKCVDPCAGVCGVGAQCEVTNHIPICFCPPQTTGDPFITCYPHTSTELVPISPNPCDPSPCGPFSRCLVSHQGFATCSCLPGYWGAPPACKPECIVSSECPQTQACINKKCVNPCAGTCGANALCTVINHNPICSCPPGQQGDPFSACYTPEVPQLPKTPENPCVPTPCGPNSICQVKQGRPVCSCDKNYIGTPPYCRPECTLNQECPQNKACIKEKCMDPCIELCGRNAKCNVINHQPFCACLEGFQGDAFIGCSKIPKPLPAPDPCHPSPCGENAQCSVSDGVARCTCIPPYIGNPYVGGCRPECTMNSECPSHLACLSQHCRDPCQGLCGINAECSVVNHVPVCTCGRGLIGDPFTACRQAPPQPPSNPCEPSPCGPNSVCRVRNDQAICSCQIGYFGTPPLCRPECLVTSECSLDKACINQKCQDPCPGTCGVAARCQVNNHNPICSCPPNYVGDPFVQCTKQVKPPPPPVSPCVPSPCGVNSECKAAGNRAVCTCLPGMFGAPPNCRPECLIDQDCPLTLACLANKCRDPCVGTCGFNAQCNVVNHRPICSCLGGFEGDPFTECAPIRATERTPASPCSPSPCGPNADCQERNGAGACLCRTGFMGDPYDQVKGCHRECELHSDCKSNLACISYKCVDPCPGTCGDLAECHVHNHIPNCVCPSGYTGDPFLACKLVPEQPRTPENPCQPSPCGPNSQCRNVKDQAVCSCLPTYVGSPPNCRPECIVSSECPADRACINQRCSDPCPNTCGLKAVCTTKNHNPICACPPGFTGDPFTRCVPQPVEQPPTTERPPSCFPSPCGPNSQCKIVGNTPTCSCLPDHIGSPPNCRPECVLNSECGSQLACINQKCKDPCPGSCGVNAQCHIVNHLPICTCIEGHTGDPFTQCNLIPPVTTPPPPTDPCNPSPCGPNAECNNGICTCLPEYIGNPYESCRPECVLSNECSRDKACIRNKCKDPCPGTCGQNARCDVINHIPSCSCPDGFTGDPFTNCRVSEQPPPRTTNPCIPSPCGPNSQCKNINDHAVCSCLQGYQGAPPSCRPECLVSAECPQNRACVNQKCIDPCPGSCGVNARCEVRNHSPICSCPEGQTGDPFQSCREIPKLPPAPPKKVDPCLPSPCGPNSICRRVGDQPSCTCLNGYIGNPPNCRPECVINPDCPSTEACINNKCKDPCPGSCGDNAECKVITHTVSCSCSPGYTGNPFIQCVIQEVKTNPCEPSPCGANAECTQRNGAGACRCIQDYMGNPYEGCRPECVLSSDCPTNKACMRNKCGDPCPGVCGKNAECAVINHVPTCTCLPGHVGDPFGRCVPALPPPTEKTAVDPCSPTPCGPYSQCRNVNDQAVCSCLPEYTGTPPNCKPECVVSSECPQNRACHKFKCANPCAGTCGLGARCEVINHNPICSCPERMTGDPFTRCHEIPPPPTRTETRPIDPCRPSPCGPNSECRAVGDQPSCSCKANFVGSPPNCRPECVVNTDCSSSLACITEKCRDPCPGSCGFNAECRVQNHIPVCTCQSGFTGDAFTECSRIPPPKPEAKPNPCDPSPCGQNAQCRDGICSCLPEYQGDPYQGCRPECTMNTDCSPTKACINLHCVDPCPGTCGQNALCDIVNHIPTCSCPQGHEGDPFTLCRPKRPEPPLNPCQPSPCGPNSACRVNNGVAVCSCLPGLVGSPPSCRPECVVSAECALTQACLNNKCVDPCPGTCGVAAKCQVVNHNPICSCDSGHTGDPFTRCYPIPKVSPPPTPADPCRPSPCGPNAACRVVKGSPACSCLEPYVGAPPNCRPECTISPECPPTKACLNQRCRDPCPGSCGQNALCTVINHGAVCSCSPGHTGDPFRGCIPTPAPPPPKPTPREPCSPSPCGANAICRVENQVAVCQCLPEYRGNPYESCRPECLSNSECPGDRACIRNKCQDPCPGTCGINAECLTRNHVPVCTCLRGYQGDAFRVCSRVIEEPPRDPCNPSPCGINTVCRTSGKTAVCECLPGFQGNPSAGGCRPECTISADCPRDRACVNTKCVDPCPGTCGFNALCNVINHSPVCSCPPPLAGDPFTLCKEEKIIPKDPCNPSPCNPNGQCRVVNGQAVCIYPECIINQDCPRDKACYSQKCRDPCRDACGLNALCQVVNHRAVCSCPQGYVGTPEVQCRLQPKEEPKPKVECTSDSDCTNDKACINTQCRNPCSTSSCGQNAECRPQLHRAVCTCRDGFTGNAQRFCQEIGCRSDSECPPTQACINKECTDPCSFTSCGLNALCRADSNHRARCYCPDNFRGDPLVRCERPECTKDDDCPYNLACRHEKCENPCNCGLGAICNVFNHRPQCSCPSGYIGNPLQSCKQKPAELEPECRMDADCPSKKACFGGVCKNPCLETKPCGRNAECIVVDSLPLRTMSCMCLPGYIGDADTECRLAPHEEPGCKSNSDCGPTETCLNRICVNPCVIGHPCDTTALCTAQDHKATCRCPPGLIGDPFVRCYEQPKTKVECTSDLQCSNDKSCINQRCQDPCTLSNPCGTNAECKTSFHRPTCLCPSGWVGNPQVICYKPECKSDSDCPYDKSCINENCLNPCTRQSCGRGAECVVRNHHAQCQCPAGTQGDALLSCITGICHYNEDCADHEACDRLNRVCRPVCDTDTCADTAQCVGRNHQPICECPPGTAGNPYVECGVEKVVPQCTIDSECPSQLACINARCINPCTVDNMCSADQKCSVLDTTPLKTIMCQCPPDTLVDVSGRCIPIVVVKPQCQVDSDCSDREKCIRGSCVEACRVDRCGVNALCNSFHHQAVCTCAAGYTGNPHVECANIPKTPVVITPPECYTDSDCGYDKTCHNEVCVNPCVLEKSCGIGAFCSANDHRAVCRCPPGFEGNARVECVAPVGVTVGCTSNSECPKSESCINRICVSPCNCGSNADCRVVNHYPTCFCRPGYSGNPQIGCVKLGCQSDNECDSDKQCYNGQCLNPCILGDPCARNAECYGQNHRAACRCPPGLEGNPFERCDRVECHTDSECPNNRACIQQRCVDPCSSIANPACARNAICYAQNHAAGCICPPHLPEGNPLSFCVAPSREAGRPQCEHDGECPSRLACIQNQCVNPCETLSPCHHSAHCTVEDTLPVRTMICTCPEGWVPNENGECHAVIVPIPPGCTSDNDCPGTEACINRLCRNPCNCGTDAECFVNNHRAVCSCRKGFEGNPNIACQAVGCRIDSECGSGRACINGNCINPCLVKDPCGVNSECFVHQHHAECRCTSGYRGNPFDRCIVIGCYANSDCPGDRQCINAQCINPCVYDNPCSPRAECQVQNHLAMCRCPVGYIGNPYVDCKPEPQPECREDSECPARLACLNNKCQDPCAILEPCQRPAECQVIGSVPVRTMVCICPPGYISSGSGTCTPEPAVKEIGACISDSDCPSEKACFNSICKNPCNCGPNAECRVKNHKPICTCRQGFDGNPELECHRVGCRMDDDCASTHTCINRQCVPACESAYCGNKAICHAYNHRAVCECPPGLVGDPQVNCLQVGCRTDSECPSNRACINTKCENPCEAANPCDAPAECKIYNHVVECICPPGTVSDGGRGCLRVEAKCKSDSECPSHFACINSECVNPCTATKPCGVNAECTVFDTVPVRTLVCQCLPGYQGNAAVQCDKVAPCRLDLGFQYTPEGACVCPPGRALNDLDACIPCPPEKGLKVDERGRCVCALERGLIIDERGNCVCPTEFGYRLDYKGNCVPQGPECERDEDCADDRYCNLETKTCDNPCEEKVCGENAICNATRHKAICLCPPGYTGNPEVSCNTTQPHMRTDFPRANLEVSCLSNGVQVAVTVSDYFNGILYVKGHSKDEKCRRVIDGETSERLELFTVNFGTCGLIHVNGEASFVLVIQHHPKLMTDKAKAYHIKCMYRTGEQTVTLGFNVSMLTTAGTIANTGPPPTCLMKIVTPTGEEINSAEIGDNLVLQVDVQPGSIYGGFARSCVAKTTEDSIENEYLVTDEDGCATDPTIFGEWDYNPDTQSLLASFNAFKFPSSDTIRFQCNIRVCFGKCQPVNCRGYNAFGRRRRRAIEDLSDNNTDVANTGDILTGQLREEITIESNAILTLEKREERGADPRTVASAQRAEDICVSMIGFIIALVITALLALVAVAVAVSCWLMAYRRRPKATGPLPHPPEFPNPLFTTPEPMAEPSPDYLT